MGLTLQQTINWSQTYIQYSPLTAGANFEPAISIATTVRNTILNSPFTWPWNRAEFAITGANTLVSGQQDYVFPITDFAYLEKISLLDADGDYGYELKDIYNRYVLGVPSEDDTAQPNAACVKFYTPGTNVAVRFLSNPDQAYTGTLTYQQLPIPFAVFNVTSSNNTSGGNTVYTGTFTPTSFTPGASGQVAGFTNAANNGTFSIVSVTATTLTLANPNGVSETPTAGATVINSSWAPIPDSFIDIFNNLFLAEAFAVVDDAREQLYRQRGVAALLSKAEGLSEIQVNSFLAQYISRGSAQELSSQLRVQQANQARGI